MSHYDGTMRDADGRAALERIADFLLTDAFVATEIEE